MVLGQVVDELIKNVKIAFSWTLTDDSAFLEEVIFDGRMIDTDCLCIETQADQLAKPTRIVILYGLCVAKHFKNRVTFQDSILHVGCLLMPHVHDSAATVTDGP